MRSQPISQVDVENELLRLISLLEEETENFEVTAMDNARNEAEFKRSWARTYLVSSGSIRNREAEADDRNSQIFLDFKVSEALMKSKREKLLFLRTSIDALRSLNANVRYQTAD